VKLSFYPFRRALLGDDFFRISVNSFFSRPLFDRFHPAFPPKASNARPSKSRVHGPDENNTGFSLSGYLSGVVDLIFGIEEHSKPLSFVPKDPKGDSAMITKGKFLYPVDAIYRGNAKLE